MISPILAHLGNGPHIHASDALAGALLSALVLGVAEIIRRRRTK